MQEENLYTNIKWEQQDLFKSWIQPSRKGNTHFFCKYCCDYVCGSAELLKHVKTKKHVKQAQTFKTKRNVAELITTSPQVLTQTRAKENDLRIASFLVEQNLSFNVADHLVELIKHLHLDKTTLEKTSCGRTKATKLIQNVMGSYGKKITFHSLRYNKFSLIIDESTDKGMNKNLVLLAR